MFSVPCKAGFYSYGLQDACTPCPSGYKCPELDQGPIKCDAGEYSAAEKTACTSCEAGYYCKDPHCEFYYFKFSY